MVVPLAERAMLGVHRRGSISSTVLGYQHYRIQDHAFIVNMHAAANHISLARVGQHDLLV